MEKKTLQARAASVHVVVAEQQQVYSTRWMDCVWYSGNVARLVFMSAYLTAFQPSLTLIPESPYLCVYIDQY